MKRATFCLNGASGSGLHNHPHWTANELLKHINKRLGGPQHSSFASTMCSGSILLVLQHLDSDLIFLIQAIYLT